MTSAYVSLMMARNMLSRMKKTKNTYRIKNAGPTTRFVKNKERRTEDTVCLLQSLKVKVSEDQTEQRETVDTNHKPHHSKPWTLGTNY